MPCLICQDLEEQYASALSGQRQAEELLANATTETERSEALVASAKARRQAIKLQRRITAHKEDGCNA